MSAEPDRDDTFRKYAPEAAAQYAKHRLSYPAKLIDTIIDAHKATGGQMDTLLDVGCGPGTATHSLAPLFQHGFGADPGDAMIQTAKQDTPTTASGEPVKYFVSTAEDLIESIPEIKPGTVDLITAATAAHWFKLPGFYAAAAELLKPGGSIAIWCTGTSYVNPHTTPNAAKVQKALNQLEEEIIIPFELPGNTLCRNLYEDLELPWTLKETDSKAQAALAVFDKADFQKIYFNKDGHVEPGEKFVHGMKGPLDMVKAVWATASPVKRWREAHKEQLEKGEIEDGVDRVIRTVKEIMAEVPEGKDRDWVDGGSSVVLMVIKKKSV